ncbi:MAG: CRISPR-associated endonuclease Cas1 [Syntrophales bacterium]|nr:CRISPR-associated endonuclease Cas1 [Syntrophales bacterium]
MVIYVRTQGARLVKEGRHILVKRGDATHHTLFTYKLTQIVLFGNIEITHRALAQLLRYDIDVVFLTRNGRYLGRLTPSESKNVFLHKRQYGLLDDPVFTLKTAKSIVGGKLANMATLLMRIKRTRGASLAGQRAHDIQNLLRLMESAPDVDSVRGYEGRASALYFEAFPKGFLDQLGFTRRVRRPPTDPVNSVLSLLYTFLMNRVYAAVRVAGLNPYPGYLHTIDYGRYSLVLDLMEEFRPIIVDTLALSLFNLKILKASDFHEEKNVENPDDHVREEPLPDVTRDPIGRMSGQATDADQFDIPEQRMEADSVVAPPSTGKYPVKLLPDAFQRVIEAFEKKLTTRFYYSPADRHLTYADAIIYQSGRFRKVIEGEVDTYQPLLLK